jgi:hypothetical protein
MFTHMVLFRFPDEATCGAVIARVRALAEEIEEVEDLVVGRDEARSDRSYDVGMVMRFADRAAFDRYNAHPAHVPVAAWIDGVATDAVAVDFSG